MDCIHICSFDSGLSDLKHKEKRDPLKVLACLKSSPRFSVFEATATAQLAKMLDLLRDKGYVEYEPQGFPWSLATLTQKGEDFLAQPKRSE